MADRTNPLLSIIVPSFNQGAFIRDTLQSCLDQDYRPIEIIVIDGASTDNTVKVLESFGDIPELNWASEPDDGVVDAVNKGLQKATGEIAAIQSSDDYYLSGSFSAVMETFRLTPDAVLVYGDVERVDAEGRFVSVSSFPEFSMERLLSRELPIQQPAAFFRREEAIALGGWNPEIPYVPDVDLWFRLAFHYPVSQCPFPLAACRAHPGQRDVNTSRIYSDYLKMLDLSKELKQAPLRLKRAAKAGAAMVQFRYGGPWTKAQHTAAAWRAFLHRPALLASPKFQRHRLVPGYFLITSFFQRLRGKGGPLRQVVGAFIYDWPRLLPAVAVSGRWLHMCNRNDQVSFSPNRAGVRCDWSHTRPLHICNLFPVTAQWLLRRALQSHPIRLKETLVFSEEKRGAPKVSFIIGYRGSERLPLLLTTLRSIAAQKDVPFECIVVEQDVEPRIESALPEWVKYVHSPPVAGDDQYNRSKAFNDGAREAQGEVLVLHDNDLLVPVDYAGEAFRLHQEGYEVSQLKRFVFYLNQTDSEHLVMEEKILEKTSSDYVIQNLCGGGSLAIAAEVYWSIGGMDEDFVGWGGEDEEFWDRCRTLNVWEYAFLPFVHLWHPDQPGKRAVNGRGLNTAPLTARKMAIASVDRIRELRLRFE